MNQQELATELQRRAVIAGRTTAPEFNQTLAKMLIDYGVELSLDSFHKQGVSAPDLNGRTVAMYPATSRDGYLRGESQPFTDILVVENGGMVLGWVAKEKVKVSGNQFVVGLKTLTRMPKEWRFSQPCPHMSEYGGIWDHDAQGWECLECGEILPDLTAK